MKDIVFSYQKSCGIDEQHLLAVAFSKNIETERLKLLSLFQKKELYQTPYASLAVPFDKQARERVNDVVREKKKLNPTVLVVVGIGGSSLGAKAIHQAIFGRVRVKKSPDVPELYFAETVDADRMFVILSVLEIELAAGNNVLINVVTKSGTTTETVANFYVILEVLKKYRPDDYAQLVVVTTDKDSLLAEFAQREFFTCLEIPKMVGGRYSVFSAVGLFPLLMTGIAIEELSAGARSMVTRCLDTDVQNNPAMMSALIQYYHYKRGVSINDLFLFSVDLEAMGKWYRQLMAESIGKEFDRQGKQVLIGITPTISLGSIDLHSVAQLYLGGPRDKCTTFVTVEKNTHTIVVPQDGAGLGGKTFSEIMHALSEGTKEAYLKNNRPFCSVVVPEKSEYSIGQFLQFKMIEVMYLGFLCNVDPFDQPNVEIYKREAQRILNAQFSGRYIMMKKKIMRTFFFVSQCTVLFGAEDLKELKSWQDEFACKKAVVSFDADGALSELEKLDESVDVDILGTGNESNGAGSVSRGGSCVVLKEESQPGHGTDYALQKLEENLVSHLEDLPVAKRLQAIAGITGRLNRLYELAQGNSHAVRAKRSRCERKYCNTCDIWFVYRDKQGRHKGRKSFCDGCPH